MQRKQLKEILAVHIDDLLQGRRRQAKNYHNLSPQEQNELTPLLNVARRVKSTLKPVHAPRQFERHLKQELLTTAREYQAKGYTPPNPTRDLLVIAACFGFIMALAGVLIAWGIYHRRAPHYTP